MNLKFLLIIFSLAALTGVSGCSTTDDRNEIPSAQEAESESAEETTTASNPAPVDSQDIKESIQSKDSPVATEPEHIVQVQPLPEEKAIPEAKAMPADTTSEVEPVSVEEADAEIIAKIDKPAPVVPPVPVVDFEKKSANDFIITVGEKNATHPSYGKGHHLGFSLDNVQGKTIILRRGEKYTFDVRTNPLHDVYFSTSPVGWGGGVVIGSEIKGQFTYVGIINFSPSSKTPDVMYYQCRNHSTMGGKMLVVNKNTSQAEIDKLLAADKASRTTAKVKITKVSAAKVKQKLTFADMMMMSAGVKRVTASDDDQAKTMLITAKQKIGEARKNLGVGKNKLALSLADEGLRLIGSASRLVPSEEVLQEQNERYLELVDAVKSFEESHKDTVKSTLKNHGKKSVVEYDKKEVHALLNEARMFADERQFIKAIPLVQKAELVVTSSINMMLDNKTIVYEITFESAEDEYKYELKRFKSYEELVPIAIEKKKPAPGAVKLMDGFVKKGRSQRDDAIKKAKTGDFPTAIAMMLSATTQVRRALRIAGVQ